jgi:KUP system potassium uptake protein
MITPAISVLSAVEGLGVATPAFDTFVVPITVSILLALFLFQRRGTARVGSVFGPIIMLWFIVIGGIGLRQIIATPGILAALFPWYAADFLIEHSSRGFFVLGAVFLVVTGGEALYADMGHFGSRPIRLTWFGIVLPGLILSYFGQGHQTQSGPA